MVMVVRAFTYIRNMRLRAAIRTVAHVWDPRAYALAMGWLLRQYWPRRFSSIMRTTIWSDETDTAVARRGIGKVSAPVSSSLTSRQDQA
jgi:hypothetical protein